MLNQEIDLIVWDIETTGFAAPKDKITEIGAIIVRGSEIEERNWILKNQGIEIPAFITELTGIDQALIDAEGRDPLECMNEFIALFPNCKRHVTHNGIKFDIPFFAKCMSDIMQAAASDSEKSILDLLRREAFDTSLYFKAKKMGLKRNMDKETLLAFQDRVAVPIVAGIKHSLDLCCQESGISLEGIRRHRALPDVRLTHQLYKSITQ